MNRYMAYIMDTNEEERAKVDSANPIGRKGKCLKGFQNLGFSQGINLLFFNCLHFATLVTVAGQDSGSRQSTFWNREISIHHFGCPCKWFLSPVFKKFLVVFTMNPILKKYPLSMAHLDFSSLPFTVPAWNLKSVPHFKNLLHNCRATKTMSQTWSVVRHRLMLEC